MNFLLLIHLGTLLTIAACWYADLSRRFADRPLLTTMRHLVAIAALGLSAKAYEICSISDAVAGIICIFVWAVAFYSIAMVRFGVGRLS